MEPSHLASYLVAWASEVEAWAFQPSAEVVGVVSIEQAVEHPPQKVVVVAASSYLWVEVVASLLEA